MKKQIVTDETAAQAWRELAGILSTWFVRVETERYARMNAQVAAELAAG